MSDNSFSVANRAKVLDALRGRMMSRPDIQELLGISIKSVSKGMGALRKEGLVASTGRGPALRWFLVEATQSAPAACNIEPFDVGESVGHHGHTIAPPIRWHSGPTTFQDIRVRLDFAAHRQPAWTRGLRAAGAYQAADAVTQAASALHLRDARQLLAALKPGVRDREVLVYFVSAPELKRIKVGYTSGLATRMKDLWSASPCELHLVGAYWAKRTDELRLHERLEPWRLYREWFEATLEVRACMGIELCVAHRYGAALSRDEMQRMAPAYA